MDRRPILIVAPRDAGKSSTLAALLDVPPYREMRRCGILSLANTDKTQYTLMDLVSGQRRLAMTTEENPTWRTLGRFFWDEEAFAWANERIIASLGECELAVFDEIGRLELDGSGLAPAFERSLCAEHLRVIAVVRTPFVDAVRRTFGIEEAEILMVGERRDE